jgi:hypothetical protein
VGLTVSTLIWTGPFRISDLLAACLDDEHPWPHEDVSRTGVARGQGAGLLGRLRVGARRAVAPASRAVPCREQCLAVVAALSGADTTGGRAISATTEWNDVDLLLTVEREAGRRRRCGTSCRRLRASPSGSRRVTPPWRSGSPHAGTPSWRRRGVRRGSPPDAPRNTARTAAEAMAARRGRLSSQNSVAGNACAHGPAGRRRLSTPSRC